MNIEKMKNFLRVDGTEEDEIIYDLISVATQEIKSRTGKRFVNRADANEDIETDAIFQQAVKIRVADYYQNRQSETEKQQYQYSTSFESMCTFIAISGDYV